MKILRSGNGSKIVEKVKPLALEIAKTLDLEIWDVRFLKEGPNWILRIFIDKTSGERVNINDCERFSRAIDKALDKLDPIDHSYLLEVCSPGIDRELRSIEHFKKCIGLNVRVKTIRPMEGQGSEIQGILVSYENKKLKLKLISGEFFSIDEEFISNVKVNF